MKTIIGVLKFLNEGENYLIKVNNYKKIGNGTTDEFDMFERNTVDVPTPFELIGNENRLNISLQNKIYGVVSLNPKQAKKVGLPNKINTSMVYRTKTIIRDGQLNSESLELIVDMITYLTLKKNNINFTQTENDTNYPGIKITLNLSGMSMSNGSTDYSLDEILDNITTMNTLKAKQKVLSGLLKEFPKDEAIPGFTDEQVEVLKDYGLNEKLQYVGIDNKIEDTKEVYTGETIEFKVKGSTMSSFNAMLKRVKEGKKLNTLDQVQYDFYIGMKDKIKIMGLGDTEDLKMFYQSEIKKIKGQLFSIKLRNTMIKITFINSPISEVAFDTEGTFNYRDSLTIVRKEENFTK